MIIFIDNEITTKNITPFGSIALLTAGFELYDR